MSWVELIADRKIREAQDEGLFDDLPGKGKPLKLEYDPRVPPEMRAAYGIMREANLLPDWIELDREIRQRFAQWDERLESYTRKREADTAAPARQDAERELFLRKAAESLRDLNRQIDRLNLIVPTPAQQRLRIPLRPRMEELSERFPRLEAYPPGTTPLWEAVCDQAKQVHLGNRLPRRRIRDPIG